MNNEQVDFHDLSRELLNRGTLLRFRARGVSMNHFIANGDILVVEPVNNGDVSTGDVIFYCREEGLMTAHRVIRKNENGILITKGDSLGYLDPPVKKEQVLGKVIRIENRNRTLTLTGHLGYMFNLLIAWSARGRYCNQGRLVRNLGRLFWLIKGKRIR